LAIPLVLCDPALQRGYSSRPPAVQHLASRVDDLVSFVERCPIPPPHGLRLQPAAERAPHQAGDGACRRASVNNYRTMTGRGFAFLSIPRSYYGALTAESLRADSGASPGLAGAVFAALQDCGLVGTSGVVDLDIAEDALHALALPAEHARELEEKCAAVWAAVSRGRYRNLYLLLREQVSEALYLQIVRNQILVDVQARPP